MGAVLYNRERELLKFIIQYQQQHGFSPKLVEMAEALGNRSVSTIHAIIRNLVDKGYLQKTDGKSRTLEVTQKEEILQTLGAVAQRKGPAVALPLMGYIAAGKPLEPYADPEATFDVASTLLSGKRTAFVLEVRGKSMIEDGILDGDFVVMEKTNAANNGDIVVALVNGGDATLKRYYEEKGKVVLRPANSEMEPIYPTEIKIQGVCVGLVRRFNKVY